MTLLSACSSDAQPVEDAAQETAQTEAAQQPGPGEGEGSAQAAGLDPHDLPDPVATLEVPADVDGDPDATMTIDFFGLQRNEKTVVGRFAFTVNSDTGSTEERWLYHYLGNSAWHPYLLDTQNLKKHSVLSDGLHRAQTSFQGAMFAPGQRFYTFAVFAAPEAPSVAVSATEGAHLIQDVAIR